MLTRANDAIDKYVKWCQGGISSTIKLGRAPNMTVFNTNFRGAGIQRAENYKATLNDWSVEDLDRKIYFDCSNGSRGPLGTSVVLRYVLTVAVADTFQLNPFRPEVDSLEAALKNMSYKAMECETQCLLVEVASKMRELGYDLESPAAVVARP